MIRILVVDDDKDIRNVLSEILRNEGYDVTLATDGEEALEKLEERDYNLVILDVMMQQMDGWSVLREIRSLGKTPVMMLTARNLENDEVFGFELGADEYVTKPFRKSILLARIKAVLKRAGIQENTTVLKYQCLTMDLKAVKAYIKDEPVNLSHTEFELLRVLVENNGIALTREQLLDKVWGMDYFGGLRTVDTHIKRLRNKLADASECIHTIRGVGYRFEGDDSDD